MNIPRAVSSTSAVLMSALAMSLLAAGCSPKDDGGSAPDGGSATIAYIVIGTSGFPSLQASFYSDVVGESTPGDVIAMDSCVDAETLNNGTFGEPVYRNVGQSVTFTTGATTYDAAIFEDAGEIVYADYPDSIPVLNADYTVTLENPAVTLTGLHMPGNIGASVTSPVIANGATSFPNAALDLAWTSAGADELAVYLVASGGGAAWICRVADDGSFTVPANVVAAIPATGNFGMYAFSFGADELDGRTVGMLGSTGIIVPYTRN